MIQTATSFNLFNSYVTSLVDVEKAFEGGHTGFSVNIKNIIF